jgi:hypothetical protein
MNNFVYVHLMAGALAVGLFVIISYFKQSGFRNAKLFRSIVLWTISYHFNSLSHGRFAHRPSNQS